MYMRVLPHHTYSFKVSEKETQWRMAFVVRDTCIQILTLGFKWLLKN